VSGAAIDLGLAGAAAAKTAGSPQKAAHPLPRLNKGLGRGAPVHSFAAPTLAGGL